MSRPLQQIADAEIVPDQGGPNAWLVRFGEEDYDLLNKSAKNRLILQEDVLDRSRFSYGGVTVDVDFQNDDYTLRRDGHSVRVPADREEHVLWSIYDEDGPRLNRLFDELWEPTVRQGLLDMLMPRFREGDNIQKTEDGWVVEGSVLVGWNAKNHPIDVDDTHVVSGNGTKSVDEDKQAREIDFSIPDDTSVTLPNGTTTTLNEVEVEFLVSVALINGGDSDVFDDGLSQAIEDSTITAFTDTKSGLHHGHSMDKHTLQMLGVTDEAADRLWYNDYDHTGVWELALRRDEFENAPIDVFDDTPNNDATKWQKIENTKQKAPIPNHVRQDLEERYN